MVEDGRCKHCGAIRKFVTTKDNPNSKYTRYYHVKKFNRCNHEWEPLMPELVKAV